MYKKKPFFIVFEGVEGCGKSYQCKKLFNDNDENFTETFEEEILLDIMTNNNIDPHSHYYKLV